MEQTDVPARDRSKGAMASLTRALSTEVRASHDSSGAREAAYVRARRQTLKTRLWFVVGLGAIAGAAGLRSVHGAVAAVPTAHRDGGAPLTARPRPKWRRRAPPKCP